MLFDSILDYTFLFHSVLTSIVFFACYYNSKYIAAYFGYKHLYNEQLDRKARVEWDQRTVSMLHALIVTPLSIKALYDGWDKDIFFYTNGWIYFTITVSCGYFIWDMYVSFTETQVVNNTMRLHAVAGIMAVNYVMIKHGAPVFQAFTVKILLYELSTIPLNLKGYIQAINHKSKYYEMSLLAFAISFLLIRCVWGVYFTCHILFNLFVYRFSVVPLDKSLILLVEGLITMALNLNWGKMLLRKLYQKFMGTPTTRPSYKPTDSKPNAVKSD